MPPTSNASSYAPTLSENTSVSAFFGYDTIQMTNATGLKNTVMAFPGASANINLPIDGSANVFTLTFTDGLNSGTATFTVLDNYANPASQDPASQLRQYNNSLQGPANNSQIVTITLSAMDNIDSLALTRVDLTGGQSSKYAGTLPDSSLSTAFNDAPLSAQWALGQSLLISHSDATGSSYNIRGISVEAAVIPEPQTASLIFGASVLGMLLMKRRRKSAAIITRKL